MDTLSRGITVLFNIVLFPFGDTHPTAGLITLSLLTGVGMAYVFKITSNQRKIREARDRFKARILEMRIYQDDPVLIFSALFGAVASNLVYLRWVVKPFLVLIVPVVIVFMQMDERYGRRALGPEATTILSLQLKEGFDPYQTPVALNASGGLSNDAGPVRIRETREIEWRLRVTAPGTHRVTLTADGSAYSLPVVAENGYRLIGHARTASSFIEPFLHPGLLPIPVESPFASVRLAYPGVTYPVFGWHTHWIIAFLAYSLLGALALKFVLKIEI